MPFIEVLVDDRENSSQPHFLINVDLIKYVMPNGKNTSIKYGPDQVINAKESYEDLTKRILEASGQGGYKYSGKDV